MLVNWGDKYDSLLPYYMREMKRGHEESMDEIYSVVEDFLLDVELESRITFKEYLIAYSIVTTRYKVRFSPVLADESDFDFSKMDHKNQIEAITDPFFS